MAVYVVKLNATAAGVDILEVISDEEYEIGQIIAIKTDQPTTYNSTDGRSLTVNPGLQLGGRVVDKR
jgi:hypothetical protein